LVEFTAGAVVSISGEALVTSAVEASDSVAAVCKDAAHAVV